MDVSTTEPSRLVQLVVRAQSGDRVALNGLVAEFREPILAYVNALLRDPWLAEDVTQETFLQVYRRIGDLRNPAMFRPWLFRIAEHMVVTGWRRRGRLRETTLREQDGFEDMPFSVSEAPAVDGWSPATPEDPALAAVRRAVDRLPSKFCTVLIMFYVENLSCMEIGERLNIGAGNVRVRLHRARKALRRDLVASGVSPVPLARHRTLGLSQRAGVDDDCSDGEDDDPPAAVAAGCG